MELTPENKTYIDSLSLGELLQRMRFSPCGDPWFQDDTGTYWLKRYAELRDANPDSAVAASKAIGW